MIVRADINVKEYFKQKLYRKYAIKFSEDFYIDEAYNCYREIQERDHRVKSKKLSAYLLYWYNINLDSKICKIIKDIFSDIDLLINLNYNRNIKNEYVDKLIEICKSATIKEISSKISDYVNKSHTMKILNMILNDGNIFNAKDIDKMVEYGILIQDSKDVKCFTKESIMEIIKRRLLHKELSEREELKNDQRDSIKGLFRQSY